MFKGTNKQKESISSLDTTEKDVEQHRKKECLKGPMKKRKALSDKKSMDTRKR